MRAKTIKCKAKANVDLSPAELKNLLKKAQIEVKDLRTHITGIESELAEWRAGTSVPESNWWPFLGTGTAPGMPVQRESSSTSLNKEADKSVNTMSEDEKEEFLRRENELSDLLSEKEAELKQKLDLVESLNEQLTFVVAQKDELSKSHQELLAAHTDVNLELEKLKYENKEYGINVDSLKESNVELAQQVATLKKNLDDLARMQHTARPVTPASTDSSPQMSASPSQETIKPPHTEQFKEQLKAEKMKIMMAEFDPSVSLKFAPFLSHIF